MKIKISKKKIILIISIVLLLLIGVFLVFLMKPKKINVEIYDDISLNITLNKKINKCLVREKVSSEKINDEIKKELKNDGFNKELKKEVVINKSCNKLYESYTSEKDDFKLNGNSNEIIEVLTDYNDKGFKSKNKNIEIVNKVDNNKIGNYLVIFKYKKELYTKYFIRKVEVKDTTIPEIKLNGNKEITVYLNNEYKELGCTAKDNYDGDITSNIKMEGKVDTSKKGEYIITYSIEDSSLNKNSIERKVKVIDKPASPIVENVTGLTYIKGVLLVNKVYGLPKDYNPGVNKEALSALNKMQADAKALGYNLGLCSGFRSYSSQYTIYNNYVAKHGEEKANTFSAKPGHSEHQTGLSFDIGKIDYSFGNTPAGKWLSENAHLYGFIIRYPEGKQNITGYVYEPWHVRYLGVDIATKVKQSNLSLEEYLGVN